MQKQMNDGKSVPHADEAVIRRIGEAFDAIELVAFQMRRTRVLLAGYHMF
jgi:hypothetical protein